MPYKTEEAPAVEAVLWEGIKKIFEAPRRTIDVWQELGFTEVPMPRDEFLRQVVECITGKKSSPVVYEGRNNPGEPFLTFCGTGIKEQGERINAFYSTEEGALWALLGAIQSYAQGKEGVIHWRQPPMIEEADFDYRYYAAARLVICPT